MLDIPHERHHWPPVVEVVTRSNLPQWQDEAACRGVDVEIFFTYRGGPAKPAKKICAGCEVVEECLDYAVTHRVAGVWGGTTETERRDLIRARRRAAR